MTSSRALVAPLLCAGLLAAAAPAGAWRLVTDDFDSPDRSEAAWERCAGSSATFDGSTLLLDLAGDDFAAAFTGDEAWQDYTVTGRFRWPEGDRHPALEVLVRATGRGCLEDQAEAYRVVHRLEEGVVEVLASDGFTHRLLASERQDFDTGIWYDFSLTVRGDSLDYWLNGVKLLHLDGLHEHPSGRVGLAASRRSAAVRGAAEFDDLVIMESLGPFGSFSPE